MASPPPIWNSTGLGDSGRFCTFWLLMKTAQQDSLCVTLLPEGPDWERNLESAGNPCRSSWVHFEVSGFSLLLLLSSEAQAECESRQRAEGQKVQGTRRTR